MKNIRLHPGTASRGCVTVPDADEWEGIQELLDNTEEGEMISVHGEQFPYFGELEAIGSGHGAEP